MITEEFVIIPVEVDGVVPYGIGSFKIDRNGNMTFIAPTGTFFGREIEERFRRGAVTALHLGMVNAEPISKTYDFCGDTSTTRDGGPCAFPNGHRFQAIMYCASLGDMETGETRLSEDK